MSAPASDLSRTAGLVLAGGRSSRFGADKALASFRGELMLERARRPLQALPAIAISARQGSAVTAYASACRLTLVADDPKAPNGPLAGVLAGLNWAAAAGFAFVATVPCDTPVLPFELVQTLLAQRAGAKAAYAQTAQGAHPLCAVWSVELVAWLGPALGAGKHPAVRQFQTHIGATPVWFEAANAFANANTQTILNDLERGL